MCLPNMKCLKNLVVAKRASKDMLLKLSMSGKQCWSVSPGVKELTAWLLAKLHIIRQLKHRLKMIIQTDRFRASSCKHCQTAVLVEKNLSAFLAFHLGSLRESITI